MSLMGKQREEHFPSTNGENMWTSEKSGLVIASEDGRCCRKKIHLQVLTRWDRWYAIGEETKRRTFSTAWMPVFVDVVNRDGQS